MLQALRRILNPSVSDSIANAFSRLGWTGFWIQIVIGIVPLTLIIYVQSSGGTTRRGLLLVGYLTIAGFLVLIFTTVWFYRYTRLAEGISNSTLRPSLFLVQKAAWIGVASSALGIVFSMLVILFEVAQLLIYFSCASGRSARDSNDWRRPSKLGIRCRHHASNGASRDHIR